MNSRESWIWKEFFVRQNPKSLSHGDVPVSCMAPWHQNKESIHSCSEKVINPSLPLHDSSWRVRRHQTFIITSLTSHSLLPTNIITWFQANSIKMLVRVVQGGHNTLLVSYYNFKQNRPRASFGFIPTRGMWSPAKHSKYYFKSSGCLQKREHKRYT